MVSSTRTRDGSVGERTYVTDHSAAGVYEYCATAASRVSRSVSSGTVNDQWATGRTVGVRVGVPK